MMGRGLRSWVLEDIRRDDILCTLSKWILLSSSSGSFKSLRRNSLSTSSVSSFDSRPRSFIPKNFKLPLRLWHSSFIWRRCNSARSRSMRWRDASMVSYCLVTLPCKTLISFISVWELCRLSCILTFSSSRILIRFPKASSSLMNFRSLLRFSSRPWSLNTSSSSVCELSSRYAL